MAVNAFARSATLCAASTRVVRSAIVAVALLLLAAVTFNAHAATDARASAESRDRAPAVLRFGIYPGGAAGTVGPTGRVVPEDPGKRLAALRALRPPGRPFVLHLYASYTGPGSAPAAQQVSREIAEYTAEGFQVELVLTYRPASGTREQHVKGFADFARAAVAALGANPRFVALQVTNEANMPGAPNAADGAYPGVQDALIQGIVAAKAKARARGFGQVRIGFNWAYSRDARETAFWQRLGRMGGPAFRRSVDWVGVDLYPRTWGPRGNGSLANATKETVLDALTVLRRTFMPAAGLPARIPLHISENGYPTGRGRTQAMQVTALTTAVSTVNAYRSVYNITDYRWFDLRDADSSSTSFESQYGLMRDDYAPKVSFGVYRKLIARLSAVPS